MKKASFISVIAALMLVTILLQACKHSSVENTSVEMKEYAFTPARIKVKKGKTVTWTNRDLAEHTVTVDNAGMPGGPKSDYINTNKTFSYIFNTVGVYEYHCEPHPYMKATVEVVE